MTDKLPDLPPSDDKFWKGADKHQTDMSKQDSSCDHYFVRKSGREVACKNCGIGYFTAGKLFIKNGKLVV